MSLPLNGTWKTGKPLPTNRSSFGCEIVENKIYCIGGDDGKNTLDAVDIYDTVNDEWIIGTRAPKKNYSFGSAVYNKKIYTFGGFNRTFYYDNVWIYDTESDSWSEAPTTFPFPRQGLSCCTVGSKIYCVGGQGVDYSSRVDIYDIENNTWSTGQDMPEALTNSCCLYYNSKLYVVGGSIGSFKKTKKTYAYDIVNNTWEHISDCIQELSSYCADILEDNIYILTNKFFCYNITNNHWTELPAPPNQYNTAHQHAIVNNKFYNIGGRSEEDVTNKFYSAESSKPSLHVRLQVSEQAQLSLIHNLDINQNYDWSSDNETVATVDNNGAVTSVSIGESLITCKDENSDYTSSIAIKVVPEDEDILLALYLSAGESKKLWITDDIENVIWTSSDPNIVEVDDNGQVTGIQHGLATISSEYKGDISSIYVRVE